MIRYAFKFDGYFVDHFRNSAKFRSRTIPPRSNPIRKISVVTTCMNRLSDLSVTLPKNIEDSGHYPAEFVLLDYTSTDGLPDWVKDNMMSHIESGRLVYYRVMDQSHFNPNHSRNISFRLASSSIIANVDSDNYTNKGYLERVNQCADNRVLVVPQSFMQPNTDRLILKGRFAVMREDLYGLGGFDEDLDDGYSHDDVSFVCRAIMSGFNISKYEDKYLEGRIETPILERLKHVKNQDKDMVKTKNAKITADKLARGVVTVNRGKGWGEGVVVKNFKDTIVLKGVPSI